MVDPDPPRFVYYSIMPDPGQTLTEIAKIKHLEFLIKALLLYTCKGFKICIYVEEKILSQDLDPDPRYSRNGLLFQIRI